MDENEQYEVVGDTISMDLPSRVTEQDLLDQGYKPIKAWVHESGCLVAFVLKGKLHDVGIS